MSVKSFITFAPGPCRFLKISFAAIDESFFVIISAVVVGRHQQRHLLLHHRNECQHHFLVSPLLTLFHSSPMLYQFNGTNFESSVPQPSWLSRDSISEVLWVNASKSDTWLYLPWPPWAMWQKIEMILSLSHHPRWTRQVQSFVTVAGVIANKCHQCKWAFGLSVQLERKT
jgi:hypothetical protein